MSVIVRRTVPGTGQEQVIVHSSADDWSIEEGMLMVFDSKAGKPLATYASRCWDVVVMGEDEEVSSDV